MRIIMLKIIVLISILFCVTTVATADIKISAKNSVAGYSTENTTYIKGARQRTEQGAGMTTIYQCDLKRFIQINENAGTYLVTPLDVEETAASDEKVEMEQKKHSGSKRGGVVTYITTTKDTGERKEMFGFTARHIMTTMTKEATPDACDQQKLHLETDGWYIDLQYGLNCTSDRPFVPRQFESVKPDCVDRIRYKQSGSAKLGYPLVLKTTIYGDDNRAFTTTTEVVSLTTSTLDVSLFDVPANYKEVNNFQELAGMPSIPSMIDHNRPVVEPDGEGEDNEEPAIMETKRSGVIRIGVITLNNKTGRPLQMASLRIQLITEINDSTIDAVPIDAHSTADIDAEAKQKGCDYILYTDISELKKPSTASRIGGMFGRGSGVLKEKYEARIDYRLFPIGIPSPSLTSAATVKEEGDENSILSSALEREAKIVVTEVKKKR
jgi:hypothetical protein